MKFFIFFLVLVGSFSNSYAETREWSSDVYESNLPREIYLYMRDQLSLDLDAEENILEQEVNGIAKLYFDLYDDGIAIGYLPALKWEIHEWMFGFQKGKLTACAVFDYEGKDYVSYEIEEADHKDAITQLMDTILPLFVNSGLWKFYDMHFPAEINEYFSNYEPPTADIAEYYWEQPIQGKHKLHVYRQDDAIVITYTPGIDDILQEATFVYKNKQTRKYGFIHHDSTNKKYSLKEITEEDVDDVDEPILISAPST